MKSETYHSIMFCTNCGVGPDAKGKTVRIKIPKGTSVKDFCNEKKCEHCGCTGHVQQYIPNITGRY